MLIALTGGTGLIGSRFRELAEGLGHSVVSIRRTGSPASPHWNFGELTARKPDVILHLAGENIGARRWSPAQMERIRESRVVGTQRLCEKIAKMENPPRILACASATGYYGDQGDTALDESSPAGQGFLSEVCTEWENQSNSVLGLGLRVINFRFGMVLDAEKGALVRMFPWFSSGLGGAVGDGKQWMSWIASRDATRAMLFCLESHALDGPVNIVSPEPVENEEFATTLAESLGRTCRLRIPKFAVSLAFGEMGEQLLLASTRVMPARLLSAGFAFQEPGLKSAMEGIAQVRKSS